jgi:AraC-like DNA-binding protein
MERFEQLHRREGPATSLSLPLRKKPSIVNQGSASAMHLIRLARPAPGLAHYVRFYACQEARLQDASLIQPIPARATPVIEFQFGDPCEVHWCDRLLVERSPRAVVVGLQTYRRVRLQMTGTVESFAIFFQPAGLHSMFSGRMDELTNTDQEARAVLGAWVHELEQRLSDSRSFEERVWIANTFFLRRCSTLPYPDGITRAAMSILHLRGCVRVPALAQRAGMSTRQFERGFTRQIGIRPKLYARIARFESALESKALSTAESWTDVANRLGYFDQMHMIKEFKEFSGEIPTTLLNQLETNFDAHLNKVRSGRIAPSPPGAPYLIL